MTERRHGVTGPAGRDGIAGAAGAVGAVGAQGIQGLQGPSGDPLLYYRVDKVEEAVKVLSDGFTTITSTIKGAKWAFLAVFGVAQPVGIGVLIYVLTRPS